MKQFKNNYLSWKLFSPFPVEERWKQLFILLFILLVQLKDMRRMQHCTFQLVMRYFSSGHVCNTDPENVGTSAQTLFLCPSTLTPHTVCSTLWHVVQSSYLATIKTWLKTSSAATLTNWNVIAKPGLPHMTATQPRTGNSFSHCGKGRYHKHDLTTILNFCFRLSSQVHDDLLLVDPPAQRSVFCHGLCIPSRLQNPHHWPRTAHV